MGKLISLDVETCTCTVLHETLDDFGFLCGSSFAFLDFFLIVVSWEHFFKTFSCFGVLWVFL